MWLNKEGFKDLKNKLLFLICLAFAVFQLYTAIFGNLDSLSQRSIHLMFAAVLVFLMNPLKCKVGKKAFLDILMILCIVVPVGYLIIMHDDILTRFYYVSPLTWYQYLFAIMLVLGILEGTRRVMGLTLPIIALIALAYGLFGEYLPGFFGHGGFTTVQLTDQIFLTTEGIFGIALGVSATYVILFIIFGSFLQKAGVGKYFIDFATSITRKSRGGPAKAAVISSAMFGSISGSAIANTATTGQITIPIMKKVGYRPKFAGAVESVASTGGQITPPVMGAAVFIMSEFTGIPYLEILKNAILPAILYYLAVYLMVHFEAIKLGINKPNLSNLPSIIELLKKLHNFIPIIVLIITLMLGYSPTYAVLYSIASVILIVAFSKKTRMSVKSILEALVTGVKSALGVAMACACAGIIVGIVTYTGLGIKLSSLLMLIAQNNIVPALLMTALAALILGMGLPTTPAYIVVASLLVPALSKMGVPLIAAHLFTFYFANISNITPPVALAAYTAAGIAESNPMKTGVEAFKLGIAAYIVPFMFVFNPVLLLISDSPGKIVQTIITAIIGVLFLAIAANGYFLKKVSLIQRFLFFTISILMIYPGIYTDLLGVIIGGLLLVIHYMRSNSISNENSGKSSAI